ncbi:cache domain-containing protein, partial [Bradyrhizobium sp.]|uniref:cache domain-containing protein n=1 Tax=Bradyrhizobium sp. TaxID=376 RepID=UPI00239D162F|nr:diguanylate cyclase [Bradyrhizobium sp.]
MRIGRKPSDEADAVGAGAFADGESSGRRDPILWLVACGILLIAAIAVGTAMTVFNFRDHALESSKRELENTVILLARHFDQQLNDAEVPLVDLIEQIHQAGIDSPEDFKRRMSTPEMQRELAENVSRASKVAGLNIYDADGLLINSSETTTVPGVRIDDRAYFKALKSSADVAQPQIELVLSRFTGVWKILLTRKVAAPDGTFLGVVSRAIAPAKFEAFFSTVALGKEATISMHHRDGTLLARYPHADEFMGKDFKAGSTPEAAALLGLGHGTARLFSPVDGADRLVAIQSLSRFPLSVVATTTVASSLADWRAQTRFLVVAAILSAIVVAITIVLIVRRLTWQHQSAQRRVRLEKQRLDTAV